MFFRRKPTLSDIPRELAKMGPALGAEIEKFGRELGRARRRTAGQPRSGHTPTRLPAPQSRRPHSHPLHAPEPYRRQAVTTVLVRRRQQESRHGGTSPADVAKRGVEKVAGGLRERLLALRRGLRRLRDRFRGRRSPGRRAPISIPIRRSGGSVTDTMFSVAVVGITTLFALEATTAGARAASTASAAPATITYPRLPDDLETKVHSVADAIALAEGYYAAGVHDGHSLPFRLNNPGALKKPTLAAADLPTWKDTGLVEFPSAEMGWTALRHQVRLMLTGRSGIYKTSDGLLHVADLYADGDRNWGVNVAAALGVSPEITLAELAPARRDD